MLTPVYDFLGGGTVPNVPDLKCLIACSVPEESSAIIHFFYSSLTP